LNEAREMNLKDLFKKGKKKKKKQESVDKSNLKAFLKKISVSVDQTFAGQESVVLQKIFEKELESWIAETVLKGEKLSPNAIKFGVCLGLLESLRKINEAEEQTHVTYIS